MNELKSPEKLIIRKECRVCGNKNLEEILSLGNQALINFVDSSSQQIYGAPLDLVLCNKNKGGCGLLQLKHTVPGEMLYRQFWYKSGVNQTMKTALSDIVKKVEGIIDLKENEIVVDIGSNDSTLLRSYSKKGIKLVGFEPASNLMIEARKGTTKIFNDFFCYEIFKNEFGNKKAKVITAISMFYDLDNPNQFVEDIVKTLDENGIFIIQMNYLLSMLENNAFDNIVHEHLEYYSLMSLETLLERHNLVVFDVELNELNGGSIRTYIKNQKCKIFPVREKVQELRNEEMKKGLQNHEPYIDFANRIKIIKEKTLEFIKKDVKNNKKIFIYGASTRGNTLLQFFNLDKGLIQAAADRNPSKWGKFIVGTEIPIISEEKAREQNPDYFLVLPWYFIKEFVQREQQFLKRGGKFIVPLPDFHIIDSQTNM